MRGELDGAASPAVETAAPELSLGVRALRGTLWTGVRYAAESLLRLGSNLILARLLFPEAFGLMALVGVFMTGLAMFSDLGITASVVQSRRGDDAAFVRAAWTLQVLRGVLLWCIAVLAAGLMAELYAQPQLGPLIRVAGLTALIGGFNSISLVQLQRHLQIGRLAAIELASQLVAVVVMVVWAVIHPSVWALVGGGLSRSVVKMVLSHALPQAHPLRFAWDRESVGQLLDFGKWIFLSTLLTFLAGQADRLIFGRLLTVAMLGVYSIGLMFAMLPTQVLWSIGNTVLFPAFSRRGESGAPLGATYRRAQLPVLLGGGLPVACLAATGPELIEILYDPRYADAGWMLQLLSLGTWLQILQTAPGAVLLAVGLPRWLAIGNALKFAGMLVLLPSGFLLFGPAGAIAGFAAADLFRYLVQALGVRRQRLPTLRIDVALSVLVLAGALIGRWTGALIEGAGGGALGQVAGAVGVILLIWASAAALLLRHEIRRLWEGIRARRVGAATAGDPERP